MNRDEFLDKLPKSIRIDAANSHADDWELVCRVTGRQCDRSEAYHSFLSGWDAAMETRFAELIEENHELHSRLFEIEAKKAGEITP